MCPCLAAGNLPFPRITLMQALLRPSSRCRVCPFISRTNSDCFMHPSAFPLPAVNITERAVVLQVTTEEGNSVSSTPRLLTRIPAALSFDLFPLWEEYEDSQRKFVFVPPLHCYDDAIIPLRKETRKSKIETWYGWVSLQCSHLTYRCILPMPDARLSYLEVI